MECQSGMGLGAAPASISAADISACLPESVGQGSLVTEHPRDVSPLSRRGDLVRGRTHPLSGRLPTGVGFFPHPTAAASSAFFAVRLPVRGDNGVTSFIFGITRELGRACRPVVHHPRRGIFEPPVPDHIPFWSKPDSIFGLFVLTAFISTSRGLTVSRTASSRPP
jgi:hypothetical protein